MITRRLGLLLASCLALLTACSINEGASRDSQPQKPPANAPTTSAGSLPLTAAVKQLTVRKESRDGYEREKFKLWVDADHDGCDTRKEVLLSEATKKPDQGEECRLTGGQWTSYYDGKTVTDDGDLDIDHVVPLAEAWDSGASRWSPAKRERYANDLEAERSLVAVTLSTNRSKGDQDPAQWLPPTASSHCRYATDWVQTKLRWKLAVDATERTKLQHLAGDCPEATVTPSPAP